jgi:hypothetical protein
LLQIKQKKRELTQKWVVHQVYRRYINLILQDANIQITNLVQDLKTGVILIKLVEKLANISVGKYNETPKFEVQMMDNYTSLFTFLRKHCNLNISERGYILSDIVRGVDSETMIAELLWSIITYLQIIPTLNKYNIDSLPFSPRERIERFLIIEHKHFFTRSVSHIYLNIIFFFLQMRLS